MSSRLKYIGMTPTELVLLILLLVSLVWHAITYLDGDGKSAELINLCGVESGAVAEQLGEPVRSYTGEEYRDVQRDLLAQSYRPEPPQVESDEVHYYRSVNNMWLFFIRDGRVVRMYHGKT